LYGIRINYTEVIFQVRNFGVVL